MPVRRRYLHVIRNPFDNIATLTLRRDANPDAELLAGRAKRYLALHAINCRIVEAVGADCVCHVHHEAMIADPRAELARICRFLGV